MSFVIDNQTISDLELFQGSGEGASVFELFDYTHTQGGKQMLEKIFEDPLTDQMALTNRIHMLKFLSRMPQKFKADREEMKFVEIYLALEYPDVKYSPVYMLKRKLENKLHPNNDYYVFERGTRYLAILLNEINRFFEDLPVGLLPESLNQYKIQVHECLHESELRLALTTEKKDLFTLGKLDYLFRVRENGKVRKVLNIVYELDAYEGVVQAMKHHHFEFPQFSEPGTFLQIKGLWHPFLKQPVKNDYDMPIGRNVCFLTGPNMAGKSTYMKAFGIAMYLAHLGFPVPAEQMISPVYRGLFTTINLSDNISRGYSHYYSEVQRIKYVAGEVARLKEVVVVFDELFRGTNVKDAYDASLAVISAFATLGHSLFLISTHILEVAEQLKDYDTVDFRCMEIEMKEGTPHYTYKLCSGISDERIGMYILRHEKVVETIRQAADNFRKS